MDDPIGQLIWAFIPSHEDLEPAAVAAQDGRIAGVWLLPPEMRSAAETATLVNWLQASAAVPLLVGVDAEAGLGLVMGGATDIPTAMALGAIGDPEATVQAAEVTALEAAACGINAVGAPVLDVNINPANPIVNTRAFGASPELVGELGEAFLRGMARASSSRGTVLPIGKHFPGHGDTCLDSHLHLETVHAPLARLRAVELPPFARAIRAGIPMVMTAHVAYPALDPGSDVPATLSHPILTGLLRDELGFQGVVVSDCMNMHAITHNVDPRDAVVRAVSAGCDLVLTDDWAGAYNALDRAARSGRIPAERIHQAASRVKAVKTMIFGDALAPPSPVSPEEAQVSVGTPDHAEVARRIAAASVTLVDGTLVPPSDRPLVLATRMARRFGAKVEVQVRATLAAMGWHDAEVMMLDPAPDAAQMAEARARASVAGWVALLHFNRVQSFDPEAVATDSELVRLVDSMAGAGVPITVASLGSPYALPLFEAATARLCGFSTADASLRATLDVLRGHARARGRLPVSLAPPAATPLAG